MMRNSLMGVLGSLLVLLASSNALAEEKSPVKMLGVAVLSGKVGALPETGWGFSDGAREVNSSKMLKDRKFELILEDCQYDVPVAVSIVNRVLSAEPKNEFLFKCGWNTGLLHSMAEKVRETHLVIVDGAMSTAIFNDQVTKNYPYYFSVGVPYGQQCGALFKFIKTKLHQGAEEPRVAFVYIDSAAGKDPLEEMRMYAKKLGIDLVMEEPFTFQATDFTPTLMKLRAAKADYIVLWSMSVPASTRFIKAARKYLPESKILGLSFLAWESYFDTLKDAFDGVYVLSPYPRPSETKNPLVARMLRSIDKEKRSIKIWDLYFQAYLMSLICAEGAGRADGAGDLSRDGVQKALANLKDWDAFGMYDGESFDYRAHKFPRARILKAKFETKSLEPVIDWFLVDEYVK